MKVAAEDLPIFEAFFLEASENIKTVEQNLLNFEKTGDLESLKQAFRGIHTIKGVAASLGIVPLEQLSHKLEDILEMAGKKGASFNRGKFVDLTLGCVDVIKSMLNYLEQDVNSKKEFSMAELWSLSLDGLLSILLKELNASGDVQSQEEEIFRTLTIKESDEKFLKIEAKKMDFLIDALGELVAIQNVIAHHPSVQSKENRSLERAVMQLRRVTKTMQDISLNLRMVPIAVVFNKMRRVVRDLAKREKKKIELIIEGGETEIDRKVVEELYDPLLHLVRNACDHGIETPSQRKKAGKPETGRIYLRAYYKGKHVVIEVEDDGRGLNKEKIFEKAVEKGLVEKDKKLDDQEIFRFIFLPGFSTASEIGEISGRGIGMDVVWQTVSKLRGKVDVQSSVGSGTVFRITLPLTVAIIDGIIIQIGDEEFVIPTENVKRIIKPTQQDYVPVTGKGELLRFQDRLINLVRLYELFKIDAKYKNPWESMVVVVEGLRGDYGIMVDGIKRKQEVVIKGLGRLMKDAAGIVGGTVLAEGKVALILDVYGLETLFYTNIQQKEGEYAEAPN